MTGERLKLEKTILTKYFKGMFRIEKTSKKDIAIHFQHKDHTYSIIDFLHYPEEPPHIKMGEQTFTEPAGSGTDYSYPGGILKKHGSFYLELAFEGFNANWTIYKIIGMVNDWLDNREQYPDGFLLKEII